MKLTWKFGTGSPGPAQIIIDLAPEDDPDGLLAELGLSGQLEAFLRAYPRPGDLGKPADPDEALDLLAKFARVHDGSAGRLEEMMLAARDQWRHGWGAIATAAGLPRSTVKGRIVTARERRAQIGQWYDARGFHLASPERARRAAEEARHRDDGEPGT
jgi:hypothetical protein